MPPRRANENFLEAYEVILILDDREKFGFVPSYPTLTKKFCIYFCIFVVIFDL